MVDFAAMDASRCGIYLPPLFIMSVGKMSSDAENKGVLCANVPALCSANRAPIRSECFRNLSAQFITHCSCGNGMSKRGQSGGPKEARSRSGRRTSFDDKALLVKSLQHEVKHRSTRLEYMRRKSCIYEKQRRVRRGQRGEWRRLACFFSMILDMWACSAEFMDEKSIWGDLAGARSGMKQRAGAGTRTAGRGATAWQGAQTPGNNTRSAFRAAAHVGPRKVHRRP